MQDADANKTSPDPKIPNEATQESTGAPDCAEPCTTDNKPGGPPREGGGTIGSGNLSPDQANRTGGATGGVDPNAKPVTPPRRGVTPDA